MAAGHQTLHGSCACGRNRYVVEFPLEQAQLAELRYDNTSASRKSTYAIPKRRDVLLQQYVMFGT